MIAASTARRMAATAFVLLCRSQYRSSVASFRFSHHPSCRLHRKSRSRNHQFSLRAIASSSSKEFDDSDKVRATAHNLSPEIFVGEVTSFLETDGIPWRHFSRRELRRVLRFSSEETPRNVSGSGRTDEILTMLEDRVILAVGEGAGTNHTNDDAHTNDSRDGESTQRPYSFVLSLCPTPNLAAIRSLHQKHRPNSSVSEAVAIYAWTNAHLTDAFSDYDPGDPQSRRGGSGTNGLTTTTPTTTVVHLHQDVWNRSPEIVRSRLRSKCGTFRRRIYARQTVARRIPKANYLPFLEENHLWGATGAKYGYGLFFKKPTKPRPNRQDEGGGSSDDEMLVAVATFSSKRKVKRASHSFHSFELLRFCTKMDTTVVGGLGKLVSAFVKDVARAKLEGGKRMNRNGNGNGNGNDEEDTSVEIDIITSIDRDFGSNTWPRNWQRMEVMDPVPMFVGDIDGLRRHAVGAGLTPLEQTVEGSMNSSTILRAGLPDALLRQLQQNSSHEPPNGEEPWQTAAWHGLHPVFDAGVERLMLVVDNEKTKNLSLPDLWKNSVPSYVKKHYSSNEGIDKMLNSVRHGKRLRNDQ